jgi:hypothetical protein
VGAALSDFASQNAVLEKRLPEALDFLKRLAAVNSFTANRAGVLRNGEIVAAQFHDLGFFAERVPADNPGFGDHLFLSRPGKERAGSDGFPCRVGVELLGRNRPWQQNPQTDALIEFWMRAADRLGVALLAEPRGGLSDGNYLSQLVPTLDGLGPFGLHGHTSERSADGSKLPEFVVASSFLEMGAITVAAIRELVSE